MKRQQIFAALIIIFVLGYGTFQAMQRSAQTLVFRVKDNIAYGYGGTDSSSYGVVKRLIKDHPQVDTIVLKKMPGTQDVVTNRRIARNIRKAGLKTHLDRNSFIASGAVDLFLAGAERSADCGAMIGVHTIHFYQGNNSFQGKSFHPGNMGYDPFSKESEDFLDDMGIDSDFYAFTRDAADPEGLYFLTPEDIERFDLLTIPMMCS